jgi:hypothetical protein
MDAKDCSIMNLESIYTMQLLGKNNSSDGLEKEKLNLSKALILLGETSMRIWYHSKADPSFLRMTGQSESCFLSFWACEESAQIILQKPRADPSLPTGDRYRRNKYKKPVPKDEPKDML